MSSVAIKQQTPKQVAHWKEKKDINDCYFNKHFKIQYAIFVLPALGVRRKGKKNELKSGQEGLVQALLLSLQDHAR